MRINREIVLLVCVALVACASVAGVSTWRRVATLADGTGAAGVRSATSYLLQRGRHDYRASGQSYYRAHCEMCHGEPTSGGAVGVSLSAVADRSQGSVVRAVRRGLRPGRMPSFGRVLDLDRTLRILAYVREPLSERTEPIAALADEPLADGLYRYVAVHGGVRVYRVDDEITEVRRIPLPELTWPRGIAANAVSGLLHVPFWGDARVKHDGRQFGYVACFELATGLLRWVRQYEPSIDSLAVTPDGRKVYMPSGEERSDGGWIVFDADSGDELARIDSPPGAHNTIVGPDGTRVYLASLAHDFILVADTSSDEIVMRIGPFGSSVRPFAINGRGTLAAVNVDFLSGFEVADLGTGRVLHRVQVEGHPWVDPPLPATQSHGVTFSADEGEIWVVDAYNRMIHVFDATGLPARAPVQVASIDVRDADAPASRPKWIAASRDGRLVHVSTGHILDARTHAVVGRVAPSRYFVEVQWENGRPAETYSRYGLGYRRGTDRSAPGQR